MNKIQLKDILITLPMPVFLVIEDVGWWQGADGSSYGQPYRNNLGRDHCLEDYRALAHLAKRLSMKIAIGMVMCEWDRTNFLKDIPGATWMGKEWNNEKNRGRQLDQASDYLNTHHHLLEIALHGVGHEFWKDEKMERSEFHDTRGKMRRENIIIRHLQAFKKLIDQNHLLTYPQLFIPPALNHSFGNASIQRLLKEFGIDYVITKFSRARQFRKPKHPKLTWESGVMILERGQAPIAWNKMAGQPVWNDPQPVLPLHWGNLLHSEPEKNLEIVDPWADMLLCQTSGPDLILAEDTGACFRQAAVYYLARMRHEDNGIVIDLNHLPKLSSVQGTFYIKIQGRSDLSWRSVGGKILEQKRESENRLILKLLPLPGKKKILIFPSKLN